MITCNHCRQKEQEIAFLRHELAKSRVELACERFKQNLDPKAMTDAINVERKKLGLKKLPYEV